MAAINFDATTVAPNASFDPLPAGWYNANITGSEMKPTKDGSGAYIQLELTVLDGQFANRKVFDRLNVQNSSQVAQEIAYATLSSICHATGVIQVQDTSQLHGIPIEVKLSVQAASGDYEASNKVKGYRASSQGAGGMSQAPQMAAPAQQPPVQQPPAQSWNAPQGGQTQADFEQQTGAYTQAQVQEAAQGQGWQAPQPTTQAAPQNQAPAWGQPAPAQQNAPQHANHEVQNNGQAWAATPPPTQGNTPSANATAGTPPWGQPQ